MTGRVEATTGPTILYEYKINNVVGMKTPAAYGVASEAEVVTNSIPSSSIVAYRTIQLEGSKFSIGGVRKLFPSKPSEWMAFPKPLKP